MISQRARYAVKALTALARHAGGKPMQAADIAAREDIPKKFLEQILLALKAAGYVTSQRGREGGYVLIRAPGDISVGAVLRSIDGPIAPLPCLSRTACHRCVDCPNEGA
jgi:Rrf2 family protein